MTRHHSTYEQNLHQQSKVMYCPLANWHNNPTPHSQKSKAYISPDSNPPPKSKLIGFRNHQNVHQLHDLRGSDVAAPVTHDNKKDKNKEEEIDLTQAVSNHSNHNSLTLHTFFNHCYARQIRGLPKLYVALRTSQPPPQQCIPCIVKERALGLPSPSIPSYVSSMPG